MLTYGAETIEVSPSTQQKNSVGTTSEGKLIARRSIRYLKTASVSKERVCGKVILAKMERSEIGTIM